MRISREWRPAEMEDLPDVFTGGWVGYTGYDSVRYTYPTKIPFETAPTDDRDLLDLHLALYMETVVFDNATKLMYIIVWARTDTGAALEDMYIDAQLRVRFFFFFCTCLLLVFFAFSFSFSPEYQTWKSLTFQMFHPEMFIF